VVSLLDVNVLVALFDQDHVHHEIAHDWFADHRAAGWATCPITENGFLRVVSSPRYGAAVHRRTDLRELLRTFCGSAHHRFWEDSVSIRDKMLFNLSRAGGHTQLTDVYLLGLARKMDGSLATFDRAIPLGAVIGATLDNLSIISAAGV
jgi:toxin-antitoxin system PIN domain toxin